MTTRPFQYEQEEAVAQAWVRWRTAKGLPALEPFPDSLGRADRYYASGDTAVAVEITRVIDHFKEERERWARGFIEKELAPRLKGRLHSRLFADLSPPWKFDQSQRGKLAERVVSRILHVAPSLSRGEFVDCSAPPAIRLSVRRAHSDREPGLFYGSSSETMPDWDGAVLQRWVGALKFAMEAKAHKGQLEGVDISWRVLLLDDKMLGISETAFDRAIAELSQQTREAFDEIGLVSLYNQGNVHVRYMSK